MKTPVFFRPWVLSRPIVLYIALALVLLTGLLPFGLFALNQQYVVSSFGAQTEDVSFSIQITYVGIIAFLPIQFRLLRHFEARNYLITFSLLAMVVSLLAMHTDDIHVFFVLRLFTGFLAAGIGGRMLTLIFGALKPASAQVMGSTIFYGSALGSVALAGLATAAIADRAAWQDIYLYLILAQITTLGLILLIFNDSSGFKPYPLYQIDWISFLLAIIILTSLVYTFIYGPKLYWFSAISVKFATLGGLVCALLFIIRQGLRKRPYLHLHIFKSPQFIIGITLLTLFYGMKDSIALVYGFAGAILKWNSNDVMQLAAVNLSGLVIAMAITARLALRFGRNMGFILVAGFGVMLAYHSWMYTIFSTDLSFGDLALPVFLQGVSCGLLFVPIVAFSLSSLPAYTGFAGATIGAVARLVAALNSGAGLYSLQLFYVQSNKENFLNGLTDSNLLYNERLSMYAKIFSNQGFSFQQATSLGQGVLFKNMLVQSQLLANMAIFKNIAILSAIVLVGVSILSIAKLKKSRKQLE